MLKIKSENGNAGLYSIAIGPFALLVVFVIVIGFSLFLYRDNAQQKALFESSVFEARVESFELKTFQLPCCPDNKFQNRVFFLVRFNRGVRILNQQTRLSYPESQEFLVDLNNQTRESYKPTIDYVEILKSLADGKSRKWLAQSNFRYQPTDADGKKLTVITSLEVVAAEHEKS